MKILQRASLILALLCADGAATAKPAPSTPFKLLASGGGAWSVKCEVEIGNGNIDHYDLHPDKGGQGSFNNDKFKRVTCEYRAAPDKPLTIGIEATGWACALQATTAERCEQVVAPGRSGKFTARPR